MGNLDLERKEAHSEIRPSALGLEQQRFRGKSVGFRVGCQGPKEAMVGRPGAEKSGFGRKGAQGNLRPQQEVKKLWNGNLGSTEPGGSVFGRHRQYSLYRVSASRVLHQFAWGGFLWCCVRSRQIGGNFFINRVPKLCS